MDDPDVPTQQEVWMLPESEYVIQIGLFRVENGEIVEMIKHTAADVQVTSKKEARYYFGQFTDLARRVRKLNRAHTRLF